ncbi:DUF4917 family protein [Variovorax sp. Sphag1AA]|uniref:DUF4917 family protein n=1 Tax=Variovorax sp. Sphag1AA TaxID=2587027 RepID=UPI001613738E|nr:DUF4917 family protein [Variovorax sp. Sphag1AA]MBB3180988.1 hypothetical protein [Variovorax sp. Sphag1AA]
MLTFDEAWETLPDGVRPAILLGNGFSRAWDNDIFDYSSLFQAANFEGRDAEIRALFDRLGTWDFEAVMRSLVSSQIVGEVYGFDPSLITAIKGDQEILKRALLAAVSKSHPDLPDKVNATQFRAVKTFLSSFGQIFTVNYDLLMYWARNQTVDPIWQTDDGFRQGRLWKGFGTQQEVHFLHGGLHIYEHPEGVKKHAYTGEIGGGIVGQVRSNLEETPPRFPLFVAEPNHERKKQRIDRSPYLSFCLRALGNVDEPIFILGHSMDENDFHIFDAIKRSQSQQIFVSVHGDENSLSNSRLKANAMAYLSSTLTKVDFFDASTAKPWG